MEPLIKITSEPIRIERFSQNARLVSSNSVDMERRKAIARRISMQHASSSVSVSDLTRINRTFSKSSVTSQGPDSSYQQIVSRQARMSASTSTPRKAVPVQTAPLSVPKASAGEVVSEQTAPVSVPVSSPAPSQNISVETSSSYAVQRGSLEMRVARGDLTYLPPLTMTIVTQRPSVHVEYLGGFNYVPPRDDSGGNVNLFT
ncbi:hypothetical protein AALB16_03440 [Lachnospiraceae bacterium 62-35]